MRAHAEPPDPRDIVLPASSAPRSERWLVERTRDVRVAAILVPFVTVERQLHLLMTERAAHLRHHPGQISFPGGAAEAGDANLAATAVRETEEEVGIPREQVEVLAYLRPQWTISNYAMTPVVGLIDELPALTLDTSEVAEAFLVPARHVLDPAQQQQQWREFDGARFETFEIDWQGRRIWGATATVLNRLSKIIDYSKL